MTFSENSLLEYPDPDTPIWRYVEYPKFNWMLQTRQLHFHQAAEQEDPYEGGIPKAVEERHKASDTPFSFDEYRDVAKHSRELTFLNCWHINDKESAGMWDLYGRSGRSIAIKSTVGKLDEALNAGTDYPIGAGYVWYADYDSSWNDLDQDSKDALDRVVFQDGINTRDLFHLKRDTFSHEKEFRTYAHFHEYMNQETFEYLPRDYDSPFDITESEEYSVYTTVPDGIGFNVDVDVDDMVDEIHIAPNASSWVVDSVKATLSNAYDLNLSFSDVRLSSLYDDPWGE